MGDLRAWGRASAIGAASEAERPGSRVVGTEHLLVATLADPTVRWAFRTIGVDPRDVEAEVATVSLRRRSRAGSEPITADAAEAVMQASDGDDGLDLDEPDAADIARVRRALARRFLSRTRHSDARDVLDLLGVIKYRTRVLATIEHNAQRTPAPVDRAGPTDGRRSTRSDVFGLAGRDPEPPAG